MAVEIFGENDRIQDIGDPVTEDDIRLHKERTEIEDRSFKLRTIINKWAEQHEADRKLRLKYAYWLLGALFFQIITINTIVFLYGFGIIILQEWVANIFVMSVFTEVTTMIFIILKYLFPKSGAEFLNLIEKL